MKVRAILWLGVYQLLMQEHGRAYAAVDSSVELAKQSGVGRSAGLVNAVLRAITRLQPTIEKRGGFSRATFPLSFTQQVRLNRPIFPDPAADFRGHLAMVTSHPRALVDMLAGAHGETVAADILIRNNQRPVVLLRRDDAAFAPAEESGLVPHENPRFLCAAQGWNEHIAALVAAGRLSPQDPTSARPVEALVRESAAHGLAPTRILDLCAGLGTKSIQFARAFPAATVTAADIDARKLARLAARAADLQLPHVVTVSLGGPAAGGPPLRGPFDIVLVDVPCSNTGVMARRVQSRWRWPDLDRGLLKRTQLALLDQAAGLAAPGGLLLYSTCALDPAENRGIIDEFRTTRPTPPELLHEEPTLPSFTHDPTRQHDGGYLAMWRA